MAKSIHNPPFGTRIGTWAWAATPNRVFADPLMSTYFGIDASVGARGAAPARFAAAIHKEDRDRVIRSMRRAMVSGGAFSERCRVYTLLGKERLILVEGRCFSDREGTPRLYPGHIVDIGDYIGDCGAIDELRDLLDRALVLAKIQRMNLTQYFIAMSIAEISEIRNSIKETKTLLN